MPCFVLFFAEFCLPSAVMGPWDFLPFSRAASRWASEVVLRCLRVDVEIVDG